MRFPLLQLNISNGFVLLAGIADGVPCAAFFCAIPNSQNQIGLIHHEYVALLHTPPMVSGGNFHNLVALFEKGCPLLYGNAQVIAGWYGIRKGGFQHYVRMVSLEMEYKTGEIHIGPLCHTRNEVIVAALCELLNGF